MAASVANIENHIRTEAFTKRIRPSEFFLDYDRLRSGFVTFTQFFRVLWENLGIKLSEEQQQELIRRYDIKQDGRLNYRLFCDIINQPFNPNNLARDPAQQVGDVEPMEFLGTIRSLCPLSEGQEAHIVQLLRRLVGFYQYRGINLRTSCEDFDKHHIGVIQESQFYRSFPRPPDVTEEDVALLVQKYRDPERAGLLNYLNLHHDMVAIQMRMKDEETSPLPHPTNASDFLTPEPGADSTVQAIFDRIRVAVFKNRVRTIEFFKDYDKLRSGVITENQFVCSLTHAIGKEADLKRAEIQKIVEFYRLDDGRVKYKEFCDMMENAFNIPDLEKKPTMQVIRPPEGVLGRNLAELSGGEEQHICGILNTLGDQVRKRRLMMYQYFKDYDRSKGYSRVITPTQFGRILHFLSLNVAPVDFKLLCRKFADPTTGDINYPAFVQTVDGEFVNYTQQGVVEKGEKDPEKPHFSEVEPGSGRISFDDLMSRVRHHVLTNRRRVCEYFQDFDPLRSGSITKSQFRRGLSDLGLSAIGQHNLSESQFQLLCSAYEAPNMRDKVLWMKFTEDIESVFTQKQLEKQPTHQVPPHELFLAPKPGSMDWVAASDDHKEFVDQIMERLRQRANQRRVLAKPVLQDFDRHNNGHVTRGQFRQCLTMLELNCKEAEMNALEAKFCNDTGFNYLSFLEELQPTEPVKHMYVERLGEVRAANAKVEPLHTTSAVDLIGVLEKIKTRVYKERVRVHEWVRDYDKLRSGRMLRSNFRRALDLCKFELGEAELAILEDHYQAEGYPDYVNYVPFSDEIESIFTTKHLEKAPLLEVEQYKPSVVCELNELSEEMENLLQICMRRLAEQVRKNRIQLFPLFEDYDRVHNGTVSRSQFRRVLCELELAALVSSEQEWICLYEKFGIKVGGKDDFNYNAFCDMCYNLAKFEWRKP